VTAGDALLFVVVAALATNHVISRVPDWALKAWLFWPVQLANLVSISFLVGWGIPGLEGNIAVFNYVLALLFIMRTIQNNKQWGEARRKARKQQARHDDAQRERVLQALRRGEDQTSERATDGERPAP
jgi:hypothetical protein